MAEGIGFSGIDFSGKDAWRMFKIMSEFVDGFDELKEIDRGIAVFGSARSLPGSEDYEDARAMGFALAKEGYDVITGGGPGDMEAANRGAREANGNSIGLAIQLPHEKQAQSVSHPHRHLQVLLRPQGDVREAQPGLRGHAGRFRDAR